MRRNRHSKTPARQPAKSLAIRARDKGSPIRNPTIPASRNSSLRRGGSAKETSEQGEQGRSLALAREIACGFSRASGTPRSTPARCVHMAAAAGKRRGIRWAHALAVINALAAAGVSRYLQHDAAGPRFRNWRPRLSSSLTSPPPPPPSSSSPHASASRCVPRPIFLFLPLSSFLSIPVCRLSPVPFPLFITVFPRPSPPRPPAGIRAVTRSRN
jgi:hypothetical protein